MTDRFGDNTPIVRVELKRADANERILQDPLLSKCPLVLALGEALPQVLAKSQTRRYPDKVVVFQQGDPGEGLLLVLSGEVRLFARRDQDMVELETVRPGDVLGESEVLSGAGRRQTSAVAQGQVDLVEIPREALLRRGQLPVELRLFLGAVQTARGRALDEMTEFLNRW